METETIPAVAAPPGEGSPGAGESPGNGQPDLQRVAAQIAARHLPGLDPATGRRPRGRPRKDGRPAGSVAHPPSSPALAGLEEPPPDKPPYLVDPGLVERLAKAAFKGIEAWEQTQLYVRSRTIFGDEAAAREFALKSGPPPGCVEVMGAALAEISQKYDLVGQWTPEVALTVGILTWAGKDVLLFADLEKRAAKMPAGAVAQAAKP